MFQFYVATARILSRGVIDRSTHTIQSCGSVCSSVLIIVFSVRMRKEKAFDVFELGAYLSKRLIQKRE